MSAELDKWRIRCTAACQRCTACCVEYQFTVNEDEDEDKPSCWSTGTIWSLECQHLYSATSHETR